MDYKKWKSGRHDPDAPDDLGYRSGIRVNGRFRHVCKHCMEHMRTCPVCAGVY